MADGEEGMRGYIREEDEDYVANPYVKDYKSTWMISCMLGIMLGLLKSR